MHDIFSYMEHDPRYTGLNVYQPFPHSIYTDLFEDFFGPDTPTPAVTVHDFDGDEPDHEYDEVA